MNIMSICDGHNASVGLSQNGIFTFAISEERLSRTKNYFGWPKLSIKYIDKKIISIQDIDMVVLYREDVADYLSFLMPEHIEHDFKKYLWKKSISRLSLRFRKFLNFNFFKNKIRDYYSNILGIPSERIIFLNHHKAHALASFSEIDLSADWLHFVFDAEGDGLSTSVFFSKNYDLKFLSSTDRYNSLGHFYSQITSFLGMKPNQHEFKVMGLEPYANRRSKGYKSCYQKLSNLIKVKNGQVMFSISPAKKKFQKFLKETLFRERFDNVAAATQVILEEIVIDIVSYWTNKAKISKISLSGGVAMNVKLMQRLYEQDFVDQIYVVPSSGDESCVIGGCNFGNISAGINLQPLSNLYLGIERDFKFEIDQISQENKDLTFEYFENINETVARLLSEQNVVARVCGRDEFGARALGNRSIIANPNNSLVIDLINKQVKNRDFWMPFTPSILDERKDDLVENPKKFNAKYMNITFKSTPLARKLIPASLHPWDKTLRPQFVTYEQNPSYHNLLSSFYKLTGIPGVLNTSFNLHGEPNVSSTKDAINAFKKSGLQYLQIENFLIRKK